MQTDQDASTLSAPAALNAAIARLLDDAGTALEHDSDAAKSIIRRATALLRAERGETAPAPAAQRRGGLVPGQAQKVVRHIDAGRGGKFRIADLAGVTNLSVSYFARAFKRSFGESPYSFVLKRRLERAQQDMLTGDEPLSQVALACGFSDQAHMTKLFRQVIGRSPGAWRRDLRGCADHATAAVAGMSSAMELGPWPNRGLPASTRPASMCLHSQ